MGKVTAYSSMTAPSSNDVIYIVDDPDGTPVSKKITRDAFMRPGIKFFDQGTIPSMLGQGAGNNAQWAANITTDDNVVGSSNYPWWKMVLGAAGDYFKIQRAPAGTTTASSGVDLAVLSSVGSLTLTGGLYLGSSTIQVKPATPTSNAAGVTGEIRTDGDYIYVCKSTGPSVWKRATLSTF